MPTDIQTLAHLDLFRELQPEELEELAEMLDPLRIMEGEVLTRRNDAAHTFFVTLSGNYMLYFKEGRAFTLHDADNIIGMSTVMTPFRYRSTTVALTDGEVLAMPGEKFLELIQANAELGAKLMRKINDVISHRAPFTGVEAPAVIYEEEAEAEA